VVPALVVKIFLNGFRRALAGRAGKIPLADQVCRRRQIHSLTQPLADLPLELAGAGGNSFLWAEAGQKQDIGFAAIVLEDVNAVAVADLFEHGHIEFGQDGLRFRSVGAPTEVDAVDIGKVKLVELVWSNKHMVGSPGFT